jgi:carbonic anhydrase
MADLGAALHSAFPSRRRLIAAALALPGFAFAAEPHDSHEPGVTPTEALRRLMDGNARYAAGHSTHPNLDIARRASLANGQHPFATVLGCADSRVAPELIFDQGLGDIFGVRVAGNVVDDAVMASIEYSVIHLACPLVMVLGHERCGAVTAAAQAVEGKGSEEDNGTKIGALAALIEPAVRASPAGPGRVEAAVLLNARRSAERLLTGSAAIRSRVAANRLQVVSGRYDLDDGRVTQVAIARI